MIDRIIKWFRELFDLDLMETQLKQISALQPGATVTVTHGGSYTINLPAPPAYVDAGVYYFYSEPGRPSEVLTKVTVKATAKGTYRFDPSGKYFFSKKEIGSAVIIIFSDHGKLKRVTVTIK